MWTRMSDYDRMFSAMDVLRSRLNSVFTDYERGHGDDFEWRVVDGSPRTNLYDNGDNFQLVAEVPGLSKEDLDVKIQGNYLELSGTKKSDTPEGYRAHRVERQAGSFTRSFTLPADIDVERIEAVLNDGMLTLVLPKAEAAKPKQITIS